MEGSSFDVSARSRRGQLSNQESCRRIRFLDSAITSNSYEFYFISILSSFLLLFFFGGKFEKRRNVRDNGEELGQKKKRLQTGLGESN